MVNPFKKPYKEVEASGGKFASILIFGLFIFLFLYIFKPFGITQEVEVRPSVDFSKLEEVLVMTNTEGEVLQKIASQIQAAPETSVAH